MNDLTVGVVGVIGPWNYPMFTPMGSIAYALAAGNTVVFKPSEYTPAIGAWLGETFKRVAPFADIFTVITGTPETGVALTESSVGKISFTVVYSNRKESCSNMRRAHDACRS